MFATALSSATRALSRTVCVGRVCLTRCQMQHVPSVLEPSLWHSCSSSWRMSEGRSQLLNVAQCGRCTRVCTCGLRTAVDQEMADFLTDEIKLEKGNEKFSGTLPTVNGFEVSSTDGARVVLSKKANNEIVTVTMSVNDTVNEDGEDFEDAAAQQAEDAPEPQLLSKPPFLVEITNSTGETLAIQCSFPPPDDEMPSSEDSGQDSPSYVDAIEIQEVAFLKTSGDWADSDFTVQGSIMDGTLYDMLLHMLESRGINSAFVSQLVDFSTAYEHREYISFLSQLQQFVSK